MIRLVRYEALGKGRHRLLLDAYGKQTEGISHVTHARSDAIQFGLEVPLDAVGFIAARAVLEATPAR